MKVLTALEAGMNAVSRDEESVVPRRFFGFISLTSDPLLQIQETTGESRWTTCHKHIQKGCTRTRITRFGAASVTALADVL